MLDTAFAIVRRAGRRTNPAVADKNHLHHRLMRLGHGQTRSRADPVDLDARCCPAWCSTRLFVHGALSYVPFGIIALGVALYTAFGVRGRSDAAGPGSGPTGLSQQCGATADPG